VRTLKIWNLIAALLQIFELSTTVGDDLEISKDRTHIVEIKLERISEIFNFTSSKFRILLKFMFYGNVANYLTYRRDIEVDRGESDHYYKL
jgi:hypothetical protein